MKRTYISIVAIIIYWIYILYINPSAVEDVPGSMTGFFIAVMTNKTITIITIFILLWFEIRSLHFPDFRKTGLLKQIMWGTLLGVITFVLVNILLLPVLAAINPGGTSINTRVIGFVSDPVNLPALLFMAIVGAGLVEELLRIFILTRFEIAGGRVGLVMALIVSTVIFGFGHLYQGINSAIGAGVAGLLFGLVYLRKRSTLEAITCHAVFDVIAIVFGYIVYG